MHATIVLALTCLLLAVAELRAQEPPTYDDPFYKQKGQANELPGRQFFQVQESVDPFTGNLSLGHTDVHLPGNGGLDLLIQRSYNSRIWGRRDVSNPGLVAINERSVVGIGWSLHFGRVVNPNGTGSANRFLPNNPVIEMPDGSSHVLFKDINDPTQFVTTKLWRYRLLSAGPRVYGLTLDDGTQYTFSEADMYLTGDLQQVYQVTSIVSPNGNTVAFVYDSVDARRLLSATDSVGRTITFQYTQLTGSTCNHTVLSTVSVNGRQYSYQYALIGCKPFLVDVIPPVGPSWSYSYRTANPGLYELETVTYPSGAQITYNYSNVTFDTGAVDIPFAVVTQRSVAGRAVAAGTWTYSYAATGTTDQVTTIVTPCRTERYTFASFSALPNQGLALMWRIGLPLRKEIRDGATTLRTEIYAWSASAPISNDSIGSGAWNGTTGFVYQSQVLRPQQSTVTIQQDGGSCTTSYAAYDAYGNPGQITEAGTITRQASISYFVNATRNMVHGRPMTRSVTVSGQTFTEGFLYDNNGNLIRHTHFGVPTLYAYSAGNMVSETDANGNATAYVYSNGAVQRITRPLAVISRVINWDGTIQRETNGVGGVANFTYDGTGRLLTIAPPIGATWTISYDNAGGASKSIARGGSTITEQYDGFGRTTSTLRSGALRASQDYDQCGRVTFQSYTYTGATPVGDTSIFDPLGRVTRVTHPDNSHVDFAYFQNGKTVTDETGAQTTLSFDMFGSPDDRLLVGLTDPSGTTSYDYNAAGSLTQITQPGSHVTTFSRDTRDYLMSEDHPETNAISYDRDAVGNVTRRTDSRGVQTFVYDDHNRMTSLSYTGGSVTFAYNADDRRTSMADAVSSSAYTYDLAGRLLNKSVTMSGHSFVTSYSYDTRGNPTSVTYPTGRTVSLTYDLADRVTQIPGYVSNVAYHPSGRRASLALANGSVVTRTFTNRYFTSNLQCIGQANLSYTYDLAGNTTQVTDGLQPSRSQTLGCDTTHRLRSAVGIWGTQSFQYDALGNRTLRLLNGASTTYVYDSARRLTATLGAEAYSLGYDSCGSVTALSGTTLVYDMLGRLAGVGASASYDYDGDGRRVRRTDMSAGNITLYHYDQWGNVISETRPSGAMVTDYVYLNSELIARIDPNGTYVRFAAGCPGSRPVSTLVASGPPRVGATVNITINNLPQDAVFMLTGWDTSSSSFGPLPLAGAPYGLGGCTLYVSDDIVRFRAGVGGSATYPLTIPNDSSYIGMKLYQQGFVWDSTFNALGLVLSDAAAAVIGF